VRATQGRSGYSNDWRVSARDAGSILMVWQRQQAPGPRLSEALARCAPRNQWFFPGMSTYGSSNSKAASATSLGFGSCASRSSQGISSRCEKRDSWKWYSFRYADCTLGASAAPESASPSSKGLAQSAHHTHGPIPSNIGEIYHQAASLKAFLQQGVGHCESHAAV